MAYKITDACLNCGACVSTCPASAITPGADACVIDESTCLGCGVCAEGCPASAIVPAE